jgi:putative transposase
MDRDTKFTTKFQEILRSAELNTVLLPPQSPNCNAYIERFFRSLKEESLSKMIFFGEKALVNAVREHLAHYHRERPHQGMEHRILEADSEVGRLEGTIACRERLGGILKYYHRVAA